MECPSSQFTKPKEKQNAHLMYKLHAKAQKERIQIVKERDLFVSLKHFLTFRGWQSEFRAWKNQSFPLQICHYVSKRSLRASFATRPWLVFIQLNRFFPDFSPFCPVFCNPCGKFHGNFSIANQAKHIINSEINISVMSKVKNENISGYLTIF